MSSRKTTHYQLHAWEPGDDFLRTEFNENFARLDQIPEIVTGSYTGDGAMTRVISLGFRPKAVLVVDNSGAMHSSQASYGGLAVDGSDVIHGGTTIVKIVDGGFQAARNAAGKTTADTNGTNMTYHYLAVR